MNVQLVTDSETYRSGQPIHLSLAIENRGADPITLQFFTAQRYDFEIRDSDGEVVWRWSDTMGFAQVLGAEVLQPGDSILYEEEYLGRLVPGRYEIVGTVTALTGEMVGTRTIFVR
jgi:hypothetical protein